jgi:hypothetical protein
VSSTNKGEPAAELTIERPVEFVSANPYAKALNGRFVYVSVTFKVTGSVEIPVQSNDFKVVLPDGESSSTYPSRAGRTRPRRSSTRPPSSQARRWSGPWRSTSPRTSS